MLASDTLCTCVCTFAPLWDTPLPDIKELSPPSLLHLPFFFLSSSQLNCLLSKSALSLDTSSTTTTLPLPHLTSSTLPHLPYLTSSTLPCLNNNIIGLDHYTSPQPTSLEHHHTSSHLTITTTSLDQVFLKQGSSSFILVYLVGY